MKIREFQRFHKTPKLRRSDKSTPQSTPPPIYFLQSQPLKGSHIDDEGGQKTRKVRGS